MELLALQSYYSAEAGSMIELEDDVLSIVSQVRELTDGKVSIQLDPHTSWYHFVEHCEDGTDRLIFSVEELDARALHRLQAADSHSHGYVDTYDRAEHEQDEIQRGIEEASMDRIAEAGEQIAWALGDGKFGPGYKQSILVPKDIK